MMIVAPDADVTVFTVLHIMSQVDIAFYAEQNFDAVSFLVPRRVVFFTLSFFQRTLMTFSLFERIRFSWFLVGRLYRCILKFLILFFVAFFHVSFIVDFISVRFHSWIATDSVEQSHKIYSDQAKVRHAPQWMRFVNWTHHYPKIANTEHCEGQKT